jgi:hypothetical protein
VRKVIIMIIVLSVIAIGWIFYFSLQKDSQVLVVDVTLEKPPDNDSIKIISDVNASLSYSRKMEVPVETSLVLPGITVIVIQDKQEKSGWYSIPIPESGSIYGTYTVKLKLTDKLNLDEPVIILARVLDPAGNEVSVKRSMIRVT